MVDKKKLSNLSSFPIISSVLDELCGESTNPEIKELCVIVARLLQICDEDLLDKEDIKDMLRGR